LRGALDLGQLPDISIDQVLHVSIEELAPAARVSPRDSFGQAPANKPVGIISASYGRLVPQVRAEPERGIDEAVCGPGNLALRERPQFDSLHAAGQGVR
jgi:hypothetical protein